MIPMLISMPIETISKEQFIRDNLTGKLRDKLIINKLEQAIFKAQTEAKEAIIAGDIDKVIQCANEQNFFKNKLYEYLKEIQ